MEKDETIVVVIFCNCKVADTPDSMGPGVNKQSFFLYRRCKTSKNNLSPEVRFSATRIFLFGKKMQFATTL